jgi:hypothetical protein
MSKMRIFRNSPLLTGKENVIAAMQSGARFFIGGRTAYTGRVFGLVYSWCRLRFDDGSIQPVHASTAQAVLDTGLTHLKGHNEDRWCPMSTEYVLKQEAN